MDSKDSVVLVTGGNRGLGKALVQAFLGAGARKIYVGSRTPIETSDPRLQPIKEEVLADQPSHEIKAVLATNREKFYQRLQADWDNAKPRV